jgi:biotin carboxyl carrier protein
VQNKHQCKTKHADNSTEGDLVAPMPGVVIDVLVEKGQEVSQGQTLVLLESMKMQMQMRASITGIVRRIAVEPGQEVEKSALLISISRDELEE